ncbi:MAG: PDZ domain-containing protein [Kineosporiaceae bacterium]|nr:PDZ domain-containing protein [Kineosporiaceae bacterium]MBK7622577.1 PDZ domain-containing protein [Kineosporiaceae bacterium]
MSEEVAVDANVTGAPPPAAHPVGGLQPATARLMVSLLALVVLLGAASFLPVPFAVMSPGPATNTLGEVNGKPLIAITGHQTYPTTGSLDLTTVRIYGGEGINVTLWQMVSGWLDPTVAVWPRDVLFPPGQTAEQTKQENELEMASSQETATAAALTELGYAVGQHMQVIDFAEGSPAKGPVAVGDQVISVGGVAVDDGDQLRAELQKLKPGAVAQLVLQRGTKQVAAAVPTTKSSTGATVLGVIVKPVFAFPFQVKIQIEDVGGPSAGTMFALGIIDKLTPGSLTTGRAVAGTGIISADGSVAPIGGIRQKMVGAREAGATVFLAPEGNCASVVGRVPDGLSVVKISTLHQARAALDEIAAHGPDSPALPRCG